MVIQSKTKPFEIPKYSLTGDLLAFLECEVQYRFNSKGSLPPSTPVQRWFGMFIHGVMEVGFNEWKEGRLDIDAIDFEESQRIAKIVAERLEVQGLKPYWGLYAKEDTPKKKRSDCQANVIAFYSLREWAPNLYPLINDNEVKLEGVRSLDNGDPELPEQYVVQGIVDVITSFDATVLQPRNPLVKALMLNEKVSDLIGSKDQYEIIIDYKGMERPATNSLVWMHHEWQLNTYMWLRAEQLKSEGKDVPIIAGVLLYLNELNLSKESILKLKEIVKDGTTDIIPDGTNLRRLENNERFDEKLRLKRSIRVVAYDARAIEESLEQFDDVVSKIECKLLSEKTDSSHVWKHWEGVYETGRCVACDLKTFCPKAKGQHSINVP